MFPSGSSHRTPSVTCAPPPAQGETRRTTGARSAASRLSATHAPTDTSASVPRAGAASADVVAARHQSRSARIARRDARARPPRGAVVFVLRSRASRAVGAGPAPRGVTPRRAAVGLRSRDNGTPRRERDPRRDALAARAPAVQRLGRGDEAVSERTSLVRPFREKKRKRVELDAIELQSFCGRFATMPTRAHLRGRQKLRANPVESTALFDFFVRSRTARQSENNVRKSKTSTLLTALNYSGDGPVGFAFLADGCATRAGSRITPRASTFDAVGTRDESRRRSRFDKPRASRDRPVSAGTTGRHLPTHPVALDASHDGEPRALGGPRGGRRPPGRRAPRDRRPRLRGRALAPRRRAHDRARRRRQDGASFPRYRARSGAFARAV